MKQEKSFIKNAIEQNKKVSGILLRCRVCSEAFRLKSFSAYRKRNWMAAGTKISAHPLTYRSPKTFATFHWHGDTFNLPNGAGQLFKTEVCEQQGFILQ